MFRYLFIGLMIMGYLVFCASGVVLAEFYRYTDSQGVLHFTDDLNEVPPDQRTKMEKFEGVREKRIDGEGGKETEASDSPASVRNTKEDSDKNISDRIAALDALKSKLDKVYQGLKQKQDALNSEREVAKTIEEIKAVNEKTEALNSEIAAYEQDRLSYEAERKAVVSISSSD